MDISEYPNRKGALPIFRVSFTEAKEHYEAIGKRLCFDSEWTRAYRGTTGRLFSYGTTKKRKPVTRRWKKPQKRPR